MVRGITSVSGYSYTKMDWPQVLVITALISTFLLSGAPIAYNHFFGSTSDSLEKVITVKSRLNPKIKLVCGNIESISCDICRVFVAGLRLLVSRQAPEEDIIAFSIEVCQKFNIEDDKVCKGVVYMFKDEFIGVMEKLILSPEEACGLIVGEECGTPYNPEHMWNVTLPDIPKPPVRPPVPPKAGSPKLRILHLSDIHLDSKYYAGSNAVCGEPLCCRKDDGIAPSGSPAAGKYGALDDCDIPFVTVQSLFQYLATIKDQFDYVLFTGDLPAHNIWNQSRSDILTAMTTVEKLFLTYLPGKKIYNTLGNHESSPVNSFPPDYIQGYDAQTWLYEATAKLWSNWLPDDTMADIRRAGYYTILIEKGFRLISLNTNFCNNMNWWLLINTTDPMGQLGWFMDVLQTAENNNEKVHIIGHIFPGGSSCLKAWSWNYYKIVNRYENIIVGQFFGHVHNELYTMFYDDIKFERPTNVLYVPGSVTTFSRLNPTFRIYEVDGLYNGSSWYPLDYQNYYLNITEVNQSQKSVWRKEYSAKADLGLKNLYPADWDDLINRMKKDDTLFQKYYRYTQKLATTEICDAQCKISLLCDLKSGRSHDQDNLCKDI